MSVPTLAGADGHRLTTLVGPYRKDRSKGALGDPLSLPGSQTHSPSPQADSTTSLKILLSGHLLRWKHKRSRGVAMGLEVMGIMEK